MSDVEAWDADDFEPELPSRSGLDDKWEGEDEDDNVKDNWEDEDEEEGTKEQQPAQSGMCVCVCVCCQDNWEDEDEEEGTKEQQPAQSETPAYQRPKKKPLAERLAEKQVQKQKEKEEKEIKEKEEKRELTAEEKLAEKVRMQKIQEHDSLDLARGLFAEQGRSLDDTCPATENEFDQIKDALKAKITSFEESPHYASFVLKLINELAVGLGLEEVKKLGVTMTSLYHEKDRQKKEMEKKKKKKSKATIKVDRADDLDLISDATGGGSYYDDDDFI